MHHHHDQHPVTQPISLTPTLPVSGQTLIVAIINNFNSRHHCSRLTAMVKNGWDHSHSQLNIFSFPRWAEIFDFEPTSMTSYPSHADDKQYWRAQHLPRLVLAPMSPRSSQRSSDDQALHRSSLEVAPMANNIRHRLRRRPNHRTR